MDIIKPITDWPVIIQGALGSALFWLVLEVGQRATKRISAKLSKDRKTASWFSLAAHAAPPGPMQEAGRFFPIYGAIHYALKGTIIVVISAALGGVLDVFSFVGYVMAIYFYFRALSYVPHSSSLGTTEEQEARFNGSLAANRALSPKQSPLGASESPPAPESSAEA